MIMSDFDEGDGECLGVPHAFAVPERIREAHLLIRTIFIIMI
jgi:hypothetical protein